MRYVYIPVPVPNFTFSGLSDRVKAWRAGWKYRRGDETPRPVDLSRFKVELMFRHEFPKNLSQPDAEPEGLIQEGMENLRKDVDSRSPLAITFPSHLGLVKVISPPPVTRRQLPEIVAYEAKQQIPFDLSQVQWRSLFAGEHAFEGEFFMSGDVILTAVKNDDVQSSLKPLGELRDRVDLVTNRTLVRADLGRILLAQKPEATIALVEMHSEKTSLIVINQGKLWTRDIPIGGNHFTRQVCKELKLTFAKAEYLKLHAMEAEDPKVVFQSVRSVFEELVAEISKSLGFWKSVSAGKSIDKLFVTGGPSGLPGLTPYLEKNLQIPVEGFSFENFPLDDLGENDAKFVMPCLLAAQRLGYGMYRTNFIPYSSGFGLGAKAAWGIEIGQAGITAVKLLLKS